jgi:copper chaperone
MYTFHIPGMNCGGCLRAVTRAVQAIDSQAQVEADLEARIIRVASSQSETSLLNALSHGGYPAHSRSEESA